MTLKYSEENKKNFREFIISNIVKKYSDKSKMIDFYLCEADETIQYNLGIKILKELKDEKLIGYYKPTEGKRKSAEKPPVKPTEYELELDPELNPNNPYGISDYEAKLIIYDDKISFYGDSYHKIKLETKGVNIQKLRQIDDANIKEFEFEKEKLKKDTDFNQATDKSEKLKQNNKIPLIIKQDETFKNQELKIIYEITLSKGREIKLNGKILTKPNFQSENDLVFGYIFKHPNRVITREDVQKGLGQTFKFKKKFDRIIMDLGFKKKLKKIFFPDISIKAIKFINPITDKYLEKKKIPLLTDKELKELGRKKRNK